MPRFTHFNAFYYADVLFKTLSTQHADNENSNYENCQKTAMKNYFFLYVDSSK